MITIPGTALSIGAMGKYPYRPDIEDLCTFESRFDPNPVVMAKREGNCILVPRQLVGAAEADYRVKNDIGAIDCLWPARNPDQERVRGESLALLKKGIDHVIEAPTGWGKTWLGTTLLCAMGQTTLIVVTKKDLIKSWHDTLRGCGIPDNQIGHVQANKCDYKGKRVVIGMVHSLSIPDRYDPEMYRYFGMVIFDETHRMAADHFMSACTRFPARIRIGLSATPKRNDGKTPVLDAHIGPLLVHGKDIPMKAKVLVRKTGWTIPMVPRRRGGAWVKEPIQHEPGRMGSVITAMINDNFRNRKVADFVWQAYGKDRVVLVVSDRLEHLQTLFKYITEQGVPGEEIGYYVGGMSQEALSANSKRRVILATYGMVSEGTNCPWWDTGVAATPRSNIKQTLGRVTRYAIGKKQPVWLDLVDEGGIFKGFFNKRLEAYYSVGAELVYMEG